MKSRIRERVWRARWVAVLFAATMTATAPGLLQAQTKPAPSKATPAKPAQSKELEEAERIQKEADKLINAGKPGEALPLAERALAIREKALGTDDPLVADSLRTLGNAYINAGNDAQALKAYERGLAIREKVDGPESIGVALLVGNIGASYAGLGEYARALDLLQRAVTIIEKDLGPEHERLIPSLMTMGAVYTDKGDYNRALAVLQRSLAIQEKVLGPLHPRLARLLSNLGRAYDEMGDYAKALEMLQRALRIGEKVQGPEHPDVATFLVNIAKLYSEAGDTERALPMQERAISIYEKSLGPEHPFLANALNNRGVTFNELGNHGRAQADFERAMAIWKKTLAPDHDLVAHGLINLAHVHRLQGDNARALPLLERSLAIREKVLGPDHSLVAASLKYLADVHGFLGDEHKAREEQVRSLAIREKALGPDHHEVALSLRPLAMLADARGDVTSAIALSARAGEVREKHLTTIVSLGAEVQKRSYLAKFAEDLDHDIWRAIHTEKTEAARLAFTTLLRRKGRALDATAESMRVLRGKLGAEEQLLFDELQSIRSKRSTLTLRGAGDIPADKYKEMLATLEARDDVLQNQISERSVTFRATEQRITLEAVHSALPKGAALVEWSVYRPFNPKARTEKERFGTARYAACVLPSDGEPRCVDLGEAPAIDAATTRLRRSLARAANTDTKALARDLDARIMAPVRKLLGDARWVFLSPDGALHLIPFAALVDEEGHLLIERYAFDYLTSGRDLLRLRADDPPPRDAPIIVAAPDFDAGGSVTSGEKPAGTERGMRSVDFSTMSFSPLPGTAREALSLSKQLDGARLLLAAEATEDALAALHGPKILHIATHGFFLPDQNKGQGGMLGEDPLLRSGLALAGANPRKSGEKDGILTALEVSGQDFHGTKLVVLSACETGLGEVKNGDGVYGMRRSLLLAGARTQVMSLWRVDDAATQGLMGAYYGRLKQGAGRSDAMRQVQLAMLSDGDRSHPYYWASFIVSGDWTTLEGKSVMPVFGRVDPGPRGCGCRIGDAPMDSGATSALVVLLAFGMRRRFRINEKGKTGSPRT